MQNQGQTNLNQQTNHGGHEMFDVKEAISGTVDTLNQYLMLKQHVKDQELLDILNRQYTYIQDEYTTTVESFQTGKDPSKVQQPYQMNQNNNFTYGLKPSQPKKPMQMMTEISDEWISARMLGALKSSASIKTIASLETTNPVVRRVLSDSIPNTIEMAYELSIYQNKNQFYQVPQLAQQDMQQMLSSFAIQPKQ